MKVKVGSDQIWKKAVTRQVISCAKLRLDIFTDTAVSYCKVKSANGVQYGVLCKEGEVVGRFLPFRNCPCTYVMKYYVPNLVSWIVYEVKKNFQLICIQARYNILTL